MIYQIGELLGITIIVFFALTLMNYVVKYINKKFRPVLKKNETVYKIFMWMMKIIVKYHKVFGLVTAGALLAHFAVQFSWYGFNLTGGIAAFFLLLQVGLGIYGYKTNKKRGVWLYLHRGISLALLVAIIIHVN